MTLDWVRVFAKGLHVWQVDSVGVLHIQTIRMLLPRLAVVWIFQERQGRGSDTRPAKHKQPLKPEKETALFTTIHTTVVYPYDTASKKHRPSSAKPENQQRKLTIK